MVVRDSLAQVRSAFLDVPGRIEKTDPLGGGYPLAPCSCALSIKMSTLLFLPALFYLVFVHFSPLALVQHLVVLLSTQVLLSYPFLLTSSNRMAYLSQAFDFGRVFEWEFTVNWRWIGQEVFEDPNWGRRLMVAHLVGLLFWALKWDEEDGNRPGEKRLSVNPLRPTERPARGKALPSSREWGHVAFLRFNVSPCTRC